MGEPRGRGAGPSGTAGTRRGPWRPGWGHIIAAPSLGPPEVAFRRALQACASEALASLLAPSACPACPKSHRFVATRLVRATHRVKSEAGCPPLQRNPETPIFLWVFFRDQCVVHRVFLLGSGCCRFLDPWPVLGWGGKERCSVSWVSVSRCDSEGNSNSVNRGQSPPWPPPWASSPPCECLGCPDLGSQAWEAGSLVGGLPLPPPAPES